MNEILVVKNIEKSFGGNKVLKDINFSVEKGELFFILGSSGCGKTTLLRIITGFEVADKGKILLENTDITNLHPSKRKIGMVFQNYALWPHMTVYHNIAYGLEIRNRGKEFIDKKVDEIIKITKLENVKDLYPYQISGGQQQRVALARALVIEPKVLLLDEPLSNLDTKLRESLRREIKRIQKETSTTMIYVTHDQKEAMSLATRIAIMDEGKIVQIDTPLNIYLNPINRSVASFIGEVNFIDGKVKEEKAKEIFVETEEGDFVVSNFSNFKRGNNITLGFRPEFISFSGKENLIEGKITDFEYLGEITRVSLKTKKGNNFIICVLVENFTDLQIGEKISFSVKKFMVFEK